jgi:hypothetical protein
VLTAAYRSAMPTDVVAQARDSIGDALRIAAQTGDAALAQVAKDSFVQAIAVMSLIGVFGGVAAAVVAVAVLRPKPKPPVAGATGVAAPAEPAPIPERLP